MKQNLSKHRTESPIQRFLNPFILLISFLALGVLAHCAPIKNEVTDADYKRVIERVAQQRVATALSLKKGESNLPEIELFEDSCKIYRLDCDQFFLLLKERNPSMYEDIQVKE